jgi:hypothetical protein
MLDRIIFGDNQFFGINHMSEEKAQAMSEKFKDVDAIINVLDIAYYSGIRAFMFNTHTKVKQVCDHFRQNGSQYKDICFYPSMPYAHKYANLVAEKGIFGALQDTILTSSSPSDLARIFAKGTSLLFERDMLKVMQLLVDMEMKMFRGLEVKVIFLQNIVTDLLLGFGVKDVFIQFAAYIKKKYNVEPGFITLNMPKLVNFLSECGFENPIVCSAINKAGYFMNPDKKSYEAILTSKRFQPMAMSIFASGAIEPVEAVRYVCQYPSIKSIVFGASRPDHIKHTKELIENSI